MKIKAILGLFLALSVSNYAFAHEDVQESAAFSIEAQDIIQNPDGSITYIEPQLLFPQSLRLLSLFGDTSTAQGLCEIIGKSYVRKIVREKNDNDTGRKVLLNDDGSVFEIKVPKSNNVLSLTTCS